MKKKNWFALLLTAALSLSLLTGCGGSSKQSDAASGDNSADAPAASESRLDKVLAAGKITNVCEPYFAPYEFIDNTKSGQEQFRGADMELARYIAKEMGVELEIVPLEWSAVLTGVGAGKYDMAVAGMAYTPERAETMAMSKVYKPGGDQGLLVPADKVDEYTSLDDFAGKKVGFQSGTVQEVLVAGGDTVTASLLRLTSSRTPCWRWTAARWMRCPCPLPTVRCLFPPIPSWRFPPFSLTTARTATSSASPRAKPSWWTP